MDKKSKIPVTFYSRISLFGIASIRREYLLIKLAFVEGAEENEDNTNYRQSDKTKRY